MAEVKPIEQAIQKLEEHLLPTDFEREDHFEFILTPNEEAEAIEWEIKRFLEGKMYKIGMMNLSLEEIKRAEIGLAKHFENYFTPEKISDILFRANSNKESKLWHIKINEERLRREQAEKEEAKNTWTPRFLLSYMKWVSEEYFKTKMIINQQYKQIIIPLVYFITGDDRFEKELGYSFKKGLLFRGVSNLGKTYIIKLAAGNLLKPIVMYNMIEIAEQLKKFGDFELDISPSKLLCLDDVGTEPSRIMHFGSEIFWFKDFIELYYHKEQLHSKLILTTNLNFADIQDKYTFRVERRMREMFNVVDLTELPFIK